MLKIIRLRYRRKLILFSFDILCFSVIAALYYAATRLVDQTLLYQPNNYIVNSAILIVSVLAFRIGFGIYFNVWRYTNTRYNLMIIVADAFGGVFAMLISKIAGQYRGIWFFVTVAALNALLTLTSRFCYRILYKHLTLVNDVDSIGNKISVAIVGAGQTGALLAEELLYHKSSNYKPLFFIDRDHAKVGNRIAGLKVYYEDENILDVIQKSGVSEIFIALTDLDKEKASNLYHFYSKTSCKIKLYDIPVKNIGNENGEKIKRSLREFQIEDLLFRKPIDLNNNDTDAFYRDKVVLVTGGGGSIGSELCRQIAKCSPKQLIILDIYENNAYEIQQELVRNYQGTLDFKVVIASVRDRARLDAIFQEYHPEIVFHAAAHKHVPMMENNACEAIKNNIFGTVNAADMSEKYGVKKFILISTDKAVNPTNVMGASKRLCEMVIQSRTESNTIFSAVRFGNVLGSNGSVIPLFRSQIEAGGPVTITDKRIVRYFMTIPEASQLVIRAGAMAKGGELYVLDMGKPILIYDLAVNMIRLAGLTPNMDIQIEEIGLRPGEKLYEELLLKNEKLSKTEDNMIFVEQDSSLPRMEIQKKLNILSRVLKENEHKVDSTPFKLAMREIVPTFRPPEEINCNVK